MLEKDINIALGSRVASTSHQDSNPEKLSQNEIVSLHTLQTI
jgi:hypothetical protein